jgi:Uma2 family endonuclease
MASLYARFGVDHYWVVDPKQRTLALDLDLARAWA